MRKPFLAANWKMNKTVKEGLEFLEAFLPAIKGIEGRDVVIAPPFTALHALSNALERESCSVALAAQNMHHEEKGAYTGEISPVMLNELGARWVILGHSERRHIFGEQDDVISKKVTSAIRHGIGPILCIGETLEQREAGNTFSVLRNQVDSGLADVSPDDIVKVVLAYEPVWAIGTGKTASPEQAQEAHAFVRGLLASKYGSAVAEQIRILYGGSVKPSNASELLAKPDVDGALVGGAALEPDSFAGIVTCQIA